jgi:hypothetical protein
MVEQEPKSDEWNAHETDAEGSDMSVTTVTLADEWSDE